MSTPTPAAPGEPDLVVTSPQNERIKHVVRLRDRRHREAAGEFLVEGYRELDRALAHGLQPTAVFYCPALFLGSNEGRLLTAARSTGALLIETDERVFAKISYRDRPDGLVAVAPQMRRTLADLPLGAVPLVIVAEAVEKPGNLGTILRSADGAGVDAVVVADRTTDLHNPNVVRASTGTLFSVPVAEAGGEETLAWLRAKGLTIVAATPAGAACYWDAPLAGPLAVVVGTEQYGLSETWLSAADVRVRIPMQGEADSLNVATATTLLLYEILRQRRAAGLPVRD